MLTLMLIHVDQAPGYSYSFHYCSSQGFRFADYCNNGTVVVFVRRIVQKTNTFYASKSVDDLFYNIKSPAFTEISQEVALHTFLKM